MPAREFSFSWVPASMRNGPSRLTAALAAGALIVLAWTARQCLRISAPAGVLSPERSSTAQSEWNSGSRAGARKRSRTGCWPSCFLPGRPLGLIFYLFQPHCSSWNITLDPISALPATFAAMLMVMALYEEEKRRIERNMLALSNLNLAASSFCRWRDSPHVVAGTGSRLERGSLAGWRSVPASRRPARSDLGGCRGAERRILPRRTGRGLGRLPGHPGFPPGRLDGLSRFARRFAHGARERRTDPADSASSLWINICAAWWPSACRPKSRLSAFCC